MIRVKTRTQRMDLQGGKRFGQLKGQQAEALDEMNQKLITDGTYDGVDDLEEKLEQYKVKFMEFDEDASGDIDIMELKRMMEKMGQAKTHLELKKMIAEVDTNNSGTIHYDEFVQMMLGKKSSILRLILMFEDKGKEKETPKGPPPRRSLDQLP
eukprot:m.26137 g.26137  ORF g.26137 m.26137 type:complete len:154 (+) comp8797_c0_seq1:441-902(+)